MNTKLEQKLNKSYEIVNDTIIFDNGTDIFEAELNLTIDNLVSITGLQTDVRNGKIEYFGEYEFDCPVDGPGHTENGWLAISMEDIEQAVKVSNSKILQP